MFAVDKHYFYNIGGFDEGMDIWGSENLELSFKVGILQVELSCFNVDIWFHLSFFPALHVMRYNRDSLSAIQDTSQYKAC